MIMILNLLVTKALVQDCQLTNSQAALDNGVLLIVKSKLKFMTYIYILSNMLYSIKLALQAIKKEHSPKV
jgi:hypothetical protein